MFSLKAPDLPYLSAINCAALERTSRFILFLVLLFQSAVLNAQDRTGRISIKGRVYDVTQRLPLTGVSVMSTSGRGTVSDSMGYYNVTVPDQDSIWFSYQGKQTPKYSVKAIPNPLTFDISIKVNSDVLPTVTIWKSYRQDSLQNRQDYAKIFNYEKPGLGTSVMPVGSGAMGVGINLTDLIGMFNVRKTKRMESLQRRLEEEEKDKYLDYRFSKSFVRNLTSLTGTDLEVFMKKYRPGYEFVSDVSQAELGIYVLECFKAFKANSPATPRSIEIRVRRYDY